MACGTPAIWQFRVKENNLGKMRRKEVDDVRAKVSWAARFGVEFYLPTGNRFADDE